MTDQAWIEGFKVLVASLPDRELTPEMAMLRGKSYREDLDHLTDAQWWHAVRVARSCLNFFPSIKHLLDFAAECPAPDFKQLSENRLSPQERSAAIKRGVDVFRAELRRLGVPEPEGLVQEMSRQPGQEG